MSEPYDCDRDDPAACTREIECERCGVTFEAEGRLVDVRLAGIQISSQFEPNCLYCPACDALGQAPPLSPCCSAKLGWLYENGPTFECQFCNATYSVDAIRAYALGLACERLLAVYRGDAAGITANLLRAAASLGIRGKP